MWRIGSFPQNLAWIHAAIFEKPELQTDDGRPHHDSSSAVKVKLLYFQFLKFIISRIMVSLHALIPFNSNLGVCER